MKKKLTLFFKHNWYLIAVFSIMFLAFLLRFYDYPNRIMLAGDQASFSLIARYAVESHLLPLLGPFSSAGPFQTGGEWYWFIMLGELFFSFTGVGSWIAITIANIIFVFIMVQVGKKLISKQFGLLAGLFAAISPEEMVQSNNLSNQLPLALFASLALLSMLMYREKRKRRYLFLLSFCIGIASSIHLSGIPLVLLLFFTIIFSGRLSVKDIGISILGLLIPWIPVFIVDVQNNFFTFRNMMQYYLHDQYQISLDVLGRRWLTYLGSYWPLTWAGIIGGYIAIAYGEIVVSGIGVLWLLRKRKISREWLIILCSLIGMVIIIRYTHTPLFNTYTIFLHPHIILITALGCFFFMEKNKLLGLLLIFIVSLATLYYDISLIRNWKSEMLTTVRSAQVQLAKMYPNQKFLLYDFQYQTPGISLPFAHELVATSIFALNGKKIGLSNKSDKKEFPVIVETDSFYLYELKDPISQDWNEISPKAVYDSTEYWYKKKSVSK